MVKLERLKNKLLSFIGVGKKPQSFKTREEAEAAVILQVFKGDDYGGRVIDLRLLKEDNGTKR